MEYEAVGLRITWGGLRREGMGDDGNRKCYHTVYSQVSEIITRGNDETYPPPVLAGVASSHLPSGTVAGPLVGALGVRVVGPRVVWEVTPGDLIRASAVRAVSGLEKFFAVLRDE